MDFHLLFLHLGIPATVLLAAINSVTRLDELSPIGWSFTLGSFFITEVVQIYGLFLSFVEVTHIKNVLGYIFGDLFTSSYCHSGR
jgi:hypothetical protein